MKLFGMILLLLSAAELGCLAAGSLRRRTEQLRILRQLVITMMAELKCTLPLIPDMLRTLAAEPSFRSIGFLQDAAAHAEDFPACWAQAAARDTALTPEARKVVETIGETLGSTALDGQLAVLELCAERLQTLYTEQKERADQRGRLYQSMGILSGIFFVIVLL